MQLPGAVQDLPFSPAVRVGNLLYLSSDLGNRSGTTELVPGGLEPETRQTLENLKAVLAVPGRSLARVVEGSVFPTDIGDYAAMNAVCRTCFPTDPPTRSTVAGIGLALGARVEIECMAVVGS